MQFYSKKFNELSADEIYEILKSRQKVFLVEQGITCLDADGIDKESLHCFFVQNGVICAYLRAFAVDGSTVKIGRVLTLEHKKGLGRELMQNSVCAIKKEFLCRKIIVDAQVQASGYYKKMGFEFVGDEFIEEGILHIKMELNLNGR